MKILTTRIARKSFLNTEITGILHIEHRVGIQEEFLCESSVNPVYSVVYEKWSR
jgi:hypothetical protein